MALFKKVFYILPGLILAILFYHKLWLKLPHDIVFTTNYIYLAGILAIIGGQFLRFSIYYIRYLTEKIPVKINSVTDPEFDPSVKPNPRTDFETLKQNVVGLFKLYVGYIRLNYNTLWQIFFITVLDAFHLNGLMYRIVKFLNNHPTKTLHYTLYIGLYFLPKTILLLALMVDVFIFKKIEYFYLCAPLYLLERFYNNLFDCLSWFREGHLNLLIDNLQRHHGTFVDSQGNTIKDAFHMEDNVVYENNLIVTFHPGFEKPSRIKNLRDYYENYFLPVRNIPIFRYGIMETGTRLKRKITDLIFAYLYFSTWVTVLSLMLNYNLINQTLLLN